MDISLIRKLISRAMRDVQFMEAPNPASQLTKEVVLELLEAVVEELNESSIVLPDSSPSPHS